MVNSKLFLFLLSYGFYCFCSQPNIPVIRFQGDSDTVSFIKHLNRRTNRNVCGPAIQAGKEEGSEEIVPVKAFTFVDSFEGKISCFLAGYKDIIEFDKKDSAAFLCELLHKETNLHVITIANPRDLRILISNVQYARPKTILVYNDKGKEYALLLIKWLALKDYENFYLRGLFYNYPPLDIEAFFIHWNMKNPNNKIDFQAQKKEALEWIENNKQSLDKWIEANKQQFMITQESLESFCTTSSLVKDVVITKPVAQQVPPKKQEEELDIYD